MSVDGMALLRQAGHHLQKTAHAGEQNRPDVARRRQDWFDGQTDLDPSRLIFIDETGLSTKMARLRGRAASGERCRAPAADGYWKTTSFTAGLRQDGVVAPWLVDGARRWCDGRRGLPHLRDAGPGARALAGRYRGDGPAGAQGRRHQRGDRGRRRSPSHPSALLAGLQPHRARLRQAEGAPAQGCLPIDPPCGTWSPNFSSPSPRRNAPTFSPARATTAIRSSLP